MIPLRIVALAFEWNMDDDSELENNTTDRFEREAMMDDDASAIDYARFHDVRNRSIGGMEELLGENGNHT